MNKLTLDFAIIGAQKSASTFIQRALIDHPEVGMPRGESRVIEDPWYSEGAFESHVAELARRCPGRRILGIKRPDCLGLEASTERLRHHMADGKFLVTLRNPIDRALSAYFHFLRYDILPMLDFEQGMRMILDGSLKGYPLANKVLEYGLYGQHLERYFTAFDPAQFLVMKHDDIARDGENVLRRVYGFLGVDQEHRSHNLGRRSQSVVYEMRRLKFLRLRSSIVFRWDAKRTYHESRFGLFSRAVWYSFEAMDRYVLSRFMPNVKIRPSEELRARLCDYYRVDLEKAESLTGLELSGWLES